MINVYLIVAKGAEFPGSIDVVVMDTNKTNAKKCAKQSIAKNFPIDAERLTLTCHKIGDQFSVATLAMIDRRKEIQNV